MNSIMDLCQEAFELTLATSIRAGVLIVLVLLVMKTLDSRITPGWRYVFNFLVVIALLVPVAPRSSLSLLNLWPETVWFQKQLGSQPAFSGGAVGTSVPGNTARFDTLTIWQISSMVWFSGCVVLTGIAAWRHQRWRGVVKAGKKITEPGTLEILESARRSMRLRRSVIPTAVQAIESPAVFGLTRVHLLVPHRLLRELSPAELRMVFLHELARVRRNDSILNWILIVVQFIHWFNPMVWLALRRFRADRELVCDAMVIATINAAQRQTYAEVLIKLLERFRMEEPMGASVISGMGSHADLKRRIAFIGNPRKTTLTGSLGMTILLAGLGCSTLSSRSKDELSRGPDSQPGAPPAATSQLAPNIKRIDIRRIGPIRVSEQSIRSKISSTVGHAAVPETVDNDVRKLYATGLFYNVRVAQEPSAGGIILGFVMQENPRLEDLRFAGNSKFSDAELRKELNSHPGEPLNERRLFSDGQRLEEIYRKSGYPNAQVQYRYSTDPQTGSSTVLFLIAEDPPAKPQQ